MTVPALLNNNEVRRLTKHDSKRIDAKEIKCFRPVAGCRPTLRDVKWNYDMTERIFNE